jgi:hypothetical protein
MVVFVCGEARVVAIGDRAAHGASGYLVMSAERGHAERVAASGVQRYGGCHATRHPSAYGFGGYDGGGCGGYFGFSGGGAGGGKALTTQFTGR